MSSEPNESVVQLLELPEGRRVLTASALAREVLSGRGLRHAVGAEGSAPALVAHARRVVPAAAVLAGAERLVAEDAIDLERMVNRLSEAGYLRAPVVEDPGSFAVRGGILDVWPPQLDSPVRAELYGDLVLSLKT